MFTTFSFVQVRAMTPRVSPEGPDNDATPKPINPLPTLALNTNPIPIALNAPPLSDDPPSPLSTLSSLSDLDHSSSLHDEIRPPSVEPPSDIPPPSCDTAAISTAVPPQVTRLATTIASSSRGRRGFIRPPGSARLTRSASIKKQEVGSVDSDINARLLLRFSPSPTHSDL
jgi:hypothetical protein